MSHDITTIERAFALAKSGAYPTVGDIKRQLKLERFDSVEAHLQGPAINRQLRQLCDQAQQPENA